MASVENTTIQRNHDRKGRQETATTKEKKRECLIGRIGGTRCLRTASSKIRLKIKLECLCVRVCVCTVSKQLMLDKIYGVRHKKKKAIVLLIRRMGVVTVKTNKLP